jgi:hypothetical protein
MIKLPSMIFQGALAIVILMASSWVTAPLSAADQSEAVMLAAPLSSAEPVSSGWFREPVVEKRSELAPPSKLAIIACRVDAKSKRSVTSASKDIEPDWLLPLECMRVIETVTDAAAMQHLWLRQITPNLNEYGTCAKVAMTYAPEWEASHRNWLIVKIGCPTKIVDADGRTIGWHMPECQGTLPGTTYPLRCRFDPSEI